MPEVSMEHLLKCRECMHIHNEIGGLTRFDGWEAFAINHEERKCWGLQMGWDPAGALKAREQVAAGVPELLAQSEYNHF
jgi:hypothetical protein